MSSRPIDRREFVLGSAAAAALAATAGQAAAAQPAGGLKKAVMFTMLPKELSIEDRFKLAKEVGFAGVEAPPVADATEQTRMRTAAEAAGIEIHSVIYGGWNPPLTHPDPMVQQKSIQNATAALEAAKAMGADSILLVPGVVNAETPYRDALTRAKTNVRKLIPTAERLKVRILLEEVWNNFLLSPLEFVAFVDSFESPWVQAYFDVGNVVIFGWPEDWIRTLGKRIRKVHLKDFKGGPGLFGGVRGEFVNLLDGSVNWPAVRKAFADVGFSGYLTTELRAGDGAYLRDVSARVDKILQGG